jgi:hypothetical protein
MCGSGATFGLPPLSAAAFRLHASAQRIHEVDDLLLGVQSISERATVPPAWPKKHEQDHIKKLFWCFFGGGFFRSRSPLRGSKKRPALRKGYRETNFICPCA